MVDGTGTGGNATSLCRLAGSKDERGPRVGVGIALRDPTLKHGHRIGDGRYTLVVTPEPMSQDTPITDDELPGLFANLDGMPLALAVSGGADSMALMHLVARWAGLGHVQAKWDESRGGGGHVIDRVPLELGEQRPPWYGSAGSLDDLRRTGGPPQVVVLTVDHGLRPAAADEAAFVAREAESLGLPCQILHWSGDKPPTVSQATSREARRNLLVDAIRAESDWFDRLRHPQGSQFRWRPRTLMMAHHQEDQAETVLMRLARGSGLDGLCGIRRRDVVTRNATPLRPQSYSVELLRPLLAMPKSRLIATLRARDVRWIEDPSNTDERFERVRLRNALVSLAGLGITADKIALSARRLSDAESPLRSIIEDWVKPHPLNDQWLYAEIEIGGPMFAGAYFGSRTLRQLLCSYGGDAREPELAQLEALYHLACSEEQRMARGGLTLGGCRIEFRGDRGSMLRVYRESGDERLPVVPIVPGGWIDWDGTRFCVKGHGSAPSGAVVRSLGIKGWADLKRAVTGFDDIAWPAAAVATLPSIARGGEVIAHPAIDELVRRLPAGKRQVKERWAEVSRQFRNTDFEVRFKPRPW